MKKTTFLLLALSLLIMPTHLSAKRIPLSDGWRFAFGHAADPAKDFGCGTEYFNYLTKANSIHNEGPYSLKFDDTAWQQVSIPHDWVPTLPFSAEASHSHGYHTIGWKYPETSVGWYRKVLELDSAMLAESEVTLCFDGIFRDSRIWVNGFYVGHEESGYTRQEYEISDYLLPGQNLICVRVDASLEEGWWYEGAGIYRPAWLDIVPVGQAVKPREVVHPQYTFSPDSGFLVDGKRVQLKGVDLHQDHAGVGIAVPKGLLEYRLRKLQEIGVNAIRCSHNPVSEEWLDLCDSLGIYVIAETRLMGSNDLQRHVLEKMIERDKHHKCIILWSVGNEEWGLEWTDRGERIARHMQEWAHEADPTRCVTVATSSGPNIVRGVDVAGYNYLIQNDIDGERVRYPKRCAVGTEETTACGARGIYYTDAAAGHMAAINRTDTTYENIIERGWRFYAERPWLGGLFYWTGFDYVGESNPMIWPAVNSQFGLLDLCGFKKDEAYYLQSWWTDTPTLHILPHWNLEGHEGETVDIWVYSNMDEVELRVNGKNLGRQVMPRNGHLKWTATYQPGRVEAIGYKGGKRVIREVVETAGPATQIEQQVATYDGITIIDLTLKDKKGRFAATACDTIQVCLTDDARVLGWGNGDPANHAVRPQQGYGQTFDIQAFNGHAQIILQGATSIPALRIR